MNRGLEPILAPNACCDRELINVEHPVEVQQFVQSEEVPQSVRMAERAFPLVEKPPPVRDSIQHF